MLFSILLNWPLGLIIPLAGFRCHTVWEVWEGLKGHGARAKMVCGWGWWGSVTQVCSLHARFALTSGSELLQSRDLSSPGFTQLLFFKNYCYLFLHLPECSFGAHFKLGATHYNHRCPLVARKEIYKYIYKIKQKAQSDVDINKTHLWGFLNNS